jgi:exopolysaccharide biosynthesis polyprenyl glycosylphosphotransferase
LTGSVVDTGVTLADTLAEWEALEDVVGARTLEILEQRRLSAAVHRRGWLVRRLLLCADLVGLLTAFFIAELIFTAKTSGRLDFGSEALLFVATLPAWVLVARAYGLYGQDDRRMNHVTTDEVASVFNMVTVCTWLFFAFTWLTGAAHPAVSKLLLFWALASVLVAVARVGARALARTRSSYIQNTVIVGAGDIGQAIAEKLLRHPEYGVNVVGFVDTEPKEQRVALADLTILGPPERLSSIIRAFDVERVIVAFSRASHERVLELVRSLKDAFVQVDLVPRYFELVGPNTRTSAIEGVPVLCLPPRALGLSSRMLKRSMDIFVSALGLLLLGPLFVVAAVAIKLDSRGLVFFRQARVGLAGRRFSIVKFRTMGADAEERKGELAHLSKHAEGDARMFKVANDPRVTRVGRVLRRTSADELPQLWNVLRGEMSLVGPRPLIPSEAEHVGETAWGKRRLDLKPGITGLWQVLGRSDIPFEEMVRLDYLYVTNWSLWHDLRLMCGTVPAMFNGNRAI